MTAHEPDNSVSIPPEMLLSAYIQGIFPMAQSKNSKGVAWYQPDPRAILPLDQFHCPKTLQQIINQQKFTITRDEAFKDVIQECANAKRREKQTWINQDIIESYTRLHHIGFAHSVEAWLNDELVGGLYGVSIGGAYFGESMFHNADRGGTNASKVCLAHLVEHLNNQNFALLDVQINNPHMSKFGVIEISHERYMDLLHNAIALDVEW